MLGGKDTYICEWKVTWKLLIHRAQKVIFKRQLIRLKKKKLEEMYSYKDLHVEIHEIEKI